jgi:hypothetical protein
MAEGSKVAGLLGGASDRKSGRCHSRRLSSGRRGGRSDGVELHPAFCLWQAHDSVCDSFAVGMQPRRDVKHRTVGETMVFLVFARLVWGPAWLGLLH